MEVKLTKSYLPPAEAAAMSSLKMRFPAEFLGDAQDRLITMLLLENFLTG